MVVNEARRAKHVKFNKSRFSRVSKALQQFKDQKLLDRTNFSELEEFDDTDYNKEEHYIFSDKVGVRRLGEIVRINGDLDGFLNGFLNEEEREIKERYDLSPYQVSKYRNEANEIIDWGDRDILVRLGIPVDNPSRLSDVYRRVLYYVAEFCSNGREIRVDFFKTVS